MYKKLIIVPIIFLFTFSLICGAVNNEERIEKIPPPPFKQVGKVLIDHVISGFKAMAISGSGGYDVVDRLLQKSMVMLRRAEREKKIDPVFYRRYKRVLEILKLTIIDARHDKENILGDHIARELQSFIYDITGKTKDPGTVQRGIGMISEAVSFELLNLHIYLDTKMNRPALTNKYFKVPPPPPPKKKKNK